MINWIYSCLGPAINEPGLSYLRPRKRFLFCDKFVDGGRDGVLGGVYGWGGCGWVFILLLSSLLSLNFPINLLIIVIVITNILHIIMTINIPYYHYCSQHYYNHRNQLSSYPHRYQTLLFFISNIPIFYIKHYDFLYLSYEKSWRY